MLGLCSIAASWTETFSLSELSRRSEGSCGDVLLLGLLCACGKLAFLSLGPFKPVCAAQGSCTE